MLCFIGLGSRNYDWDTRTKSTTPNFRNALRWTWHSLVVSTEAIKRTKIRHLYVFPSYNSTLLVYFNELTFIIFIALVHIAFETLVISHSEHAARYILVP